MKRIKQRSASRLTKNKFEFRCSFCGTDLSESKCVKNGGLIVKKRTRRDGGTTGDTHTMLHEALSIYDCCTVHHLLEAGETLCYTDGIVNCYMLITKVFSPEYLERVLTIQPAAFHCRGPQGETLLMYATNLYTMQSLLKIHPDINACNDAGQNLLMHLIQELTKIDPKDSSFHDLFLIARYILDNGIDINAKDAVGNTAAKYLMEFDLNGGNSNNPPPRQIDELLLKLVKSEAIFPKEDSLGRNIAMHLAQSTNKPENFEMIVEILKEGVVDPKARDRNGNNLMYYVLRSYISNDTETWGWCMGFREIFFQILHTARPCDTQEISKQCLALLRCGCELGGLEQLYNPDSLFDSRVGRNCNKTLSISSLSLLLRWEPFSEFVRELPRFSLDVKKSEESISELTYYLLQSKKWPRDRDTFGHVDAMVTHLLASGVNVLQQTEELHCILFDGIGLLEMKIVENLPDSLWLAGRLLLKIAVEYKDKVFKDVLHISCKILLKLLRFWNYPPIVLFIFIYEAINYQFRASSAVQPFSLRFMMKFLVRVGGRLPPGSRLFKCMKDKLQTVNIPFLRVMPHLFSQLNEGIPSLKELCRPVVRATVSQITTSGLDLSSLRVLCHGEMRQVPPGIQDYLNFKDQPEFCPHDLAK